MTDRPGWFSMPDDAHDAGLDPYVFRALVFLYRWADEKGQSFWGYDRMAEKCGMSRARLARALATLKEAGWVTWVKRKGEHGWTSNLFTLTRPVHYRERVSVVDSPTSCTRGESTEQTQESPPGGQEGRLSLEGRKNRESIPPLSRPSGEAAKVKNRHQNLFDEFLSVYPYRASGREQDEARQKWSFMVSRDGHDPDRILRGTRRFVEAVRAGSVGCDLPPMQFLARRVWSDYADREAGALDEWRPVEVQDGRITFAGEGSRVQ